MKNIALLAGAAFVLAASVMPASAGRVTNGTSYNGRYANGIQLNGRVANGTWFNGRVANGATVKGAPDTDVLTVRSITLKNGERIVLR